MWYKLISSNMLIVPFVIKRQGLLKQLCLNSKSFIILDPGVSRCLRWHFSSTKCDRWAFPKNAVCLFFGGKDETCDASRPISQFSFDFTLNWERESGWGESEKGKTGKWERESEKKVWETQTEWKTWERSLFWKQGMMEREWKIKWQI